MASVVIESMPPLSPLKKTTKRTSPPPAIVSRSKLQVYTCVSDCGHAYVWTTCVHVCMLVWQCVCVWRQRRALTAPTHPHNSKYTYTRTSTNTQRLQLKTETHPSAVPSWAEHPSCPCFQWGSADSSWPCPGLSQPFQLLFPSSPVLPSCLRWIPSCLVACPALPSCLLELPSSLAVRWFPLFLGKFL